jgi:hypothetical protein
VHAVLVDELEAVETNDEDAEIPGSEKNGA